MTKRNAILVKNPALWSLILASGLLSSLDPAAAGTREELGRYLIRFREGVRPEVSVRLLADHGLQFRREISDIGVVVAEPLDPVEFKRSGLPALRTSSDVLYIEQNQEYRAIAVPNDPLYSEQSQMKRMNVESAWGRSTGSADVVVAISDTGIDGVHEDLAGQLWVNPGEIPDNGIDDDSNGYVDDIQGWDFVGKDNLPADENRHGTHVAGIVAAGSDNGIGVAGVSWRTRLMAVRFLDENGSGTTEGGIDTLVYAAKNGAQIINASWGGGGKSDALSDAIDFAWNRGAILVAAAGNDSSNSDSTAHYPSAYPNPGVVSVASSSADGVLSSFSNFGRISVDVVAPGSSVLSTLPGDAYGRLSGTSMAAPMVSGVAALMLGYAPALSALDLRNALFNAAILRSTYEGKISTSGDMDASRALAQLDQTSLQIWPARITLQSRIPFQFSARGAQGGISWSVNDSRIGVIDGSGTFTPKKAGQVTVTARDAGGAVAVTEKITVVAGSGGGGGCSAPTQAPDADLPETVGSIISFGLPFASGFLATRRRRRSLRGPSRS